MGSMIEDGTSGVTAGIWTVKQSWADFSVPVFPVPGTGVPETLPRSHTVVPGDSVIVRNVVKVPLFGAGFSPVSDGVPRSLPDPSCDFQGSGARMHAVPDLVHGAPSEGPGVPADGYGDGSALDDPEFGARVLASVVE